MARAGGFREAARGGGVSASSLSEALRRLEGRIGVRLLHRSTRSVRETRLYQVAPISTNLILSYVAEHLLGLPRSF